MPVISARRDRSASHVAGKREHQDRGAPAGRPAACGRPTRVAAAYRHLATPVTLPTGLAIPAATRRPAIAPLLRVAHQGPVIMSLRAGQRICLDPARRG